MSRKEKALSDNARPHTRLDSLMAKIKKDNLKSEM